MEKGEKQFINPLTTPVSRPGSDRKVKILGAAEEIISSKGFKDTTISEIAASVGIQESIIYRHFKGKEDLLFSIIEERLKEGLALLDRDLQGLNEPRSQLRKMMWGNLWYQEAYAAYSKILLFECRPAPKFYSSPAFILIQKYIERLVSILEGGVREGLFRSDLSIPIMQDLVLGLLDMTTIGFHELKEVDHPLDDFEEAATLIELIISPKQEESKSPSGDKSAVILRSAEKVFAKKGFDRTKMTEIASLAGVGDGTVYEYFANKDILFFSIPKIRFEQYRNDLKGLFHPDTIISRLKQWIRHHFNNLMADPDFLRIYVQNLFLNKGFYQSEAYEYFRQYFHFLETTFEEGKNKGIFRSEIQARVFRNMVLGTFCHMATRWLNNRRITEKDRMKEVNQIIDLLAESVLN
ncbi:MAG: TetR/AcrR family transcriptional regulator [Thermodesulfobacteriota bacterium]